MHQQNKLAIPALSHQNPIQHLHYGQDFQICKTNNGNPINYRAILLDRNPEKLIKILLNNNVKAIVPIEEWELLKKTPNAISYSNRTVSLPIYPSLSDKELNHIINIIK